MTPFVTEPFHFVPAPQMRTELEAVGSLADWDAFAASWERLELDTHMADGGRYRRRRHAVFTSEAQRIERAADQPHYQPLAYNPLNGGHERWFEPIEDATSASASLQAILRFGAQLFQPLRPDVLRWKVELHQFRIEARPESLGQPTPEGMHRDGVAYVIVLLVRRVNIQQGTTTIHDLAHHQIGEFTLTTPLDTALVDDERAFHGVTAVRALDASQPGFRDVLVVTWKPLP